MSTIEVPCPPARTRATPSLALLAASGLDSLSPRRAVRAALYAALACWAVSVYAAYFVVAPVIAVAAG